MQKRNPRKEEDASNGKETDLLHKKHNQELAKEKVALKNLKAKDEELKKEKDKEAELKEEKKPSLKRAAKGG